MSGGGLPLSELGLNKEITFWGDFDLAVSIFCHQCSSEVLQDDKIVNTLVGDGKLWSDYETYHLNS